MLAMGVREAFREEVLGAAEEGSAEGERSRRTDVHNSTQEIVYVECRLWWARQLFAHWNGLSHLG